jgi:hypothetical protein
VRHKHQWRTYMETILKTMEDTEIELARIKTKIEGINTVSISDDLKKKLGSLLEKEKALHETILNKKIEIFGVIASLGTLVAPGENIGYYSEVSHHLYFSEKECDIRVKPYLIGNPADFKIGEVVRKYETIFYSACDDAIERIKGCVLAMKRNGENELSKLIEVRKTLAKLKV